jgi:thiol-disulfide isomerase/thioredoxin
VVPNQSSLQMSALGARYNLSLIVEDQLSLSGFERNHFFQNEGDFFEVGSVLGAGSVLDGRGVARGDLDNDGDLDLVVSNRNYPHLTILRNDLAPGGHFLSVALRGVRSNRQGIGARLTASCGERRQVRMVSLGDGFVSESDTAAWFGLGDCRRIDTLEIAWPGGARQVLRDVPADRRIVVTEGEEAFTSLLPSRPGRDLPSPPPTAPPLLAGVKAADVKAPAWSLPALAGPRKGQPLRYDPSGERSDFPSTLLVNFWATWCVVCPSEMKELAAIEEDLAGLGAGVVGISLDESEPALVSLHADRLRVPYPLVQDREGQVFRAVVEALDLGSGSVPLSLLVRDGVVRKVFVGRTSGSEMLEAVRGLGGAGSRGQGAAPKGGGR